MSRLMTPILQEPSRTPRDEPVAPRLVTGAREPDANGTGTRLLSCCSDRKCSVTSQQLTVSCSAAAVLDDRTHFVWERQEMQFGDE